MHAAAASRNAIVCGRLDMVRYSLVREVMLDLI